MAGVPRITAKERPGRLDAVGSSLNRMGGVELQAWCGWLGRAVLGTARQAWLVNAGQGTSRIVAEWQARLAGALFGSDRKGSAGTSWRGEVGQARPSRGRRGKPWHDAVTPDPVRTGGAEHGRHGISGKSR